MNQPLFGPIGPDVLVNDSDDGGAKVRKNRTASALHWLSSRYGGDDVGRKKR
ncbi:MAG TPA: hypothetical protein VK404_06160 [Spirosoma sp.]|nr:hypothetical protein [Spirosoma sp.]